MTSEELPSSSNGIIYPNDNKPSDDMGFSKRE